MKKYTIVQFIITPLVLLAALSSFGFSNPNTPPQPPRDGRSYFISLKDFTQEEVKGLGFTLTKDLTVHINAVGGGNKNSWKEFWDTKSRSNDMFAAGWIINADTREVVWEMTMNNTSGREEERTCEEDLSLKKGSYEVYFAAHGYASSSGMNFYSVNIDRRSDKTKPRKFVDKFLGWFSDDYKDVYAEFMEKAKTVWGIYLSAPKAEGSSISTFSTPKKSSAVIFAATGVGDGAFVRKLVTVSRDITVRIYALGEGRGKNEVFDYGWLTNTETRERVWEMNYLNTHYAGGAAKNIMFDGDVRLSKGKYELNYVTDDSHSRDDWNSKPPYDPFNYGVTLIAKNESDKSAVTVTDYSDDRKNIIVQLTRARNNDFLQAGFTLKEETRLHIYALGEGHVSSNELADYGWIINAKTRDRVWEMKMRNTVHAGGASKNRLADEFITLPKGDYLVYYQTDDSHAYNDWNDDKPYDSESYGITIMGAGENFSPKNIAPFTESESENTYVQLIRVRNDKHVRQRFTLDKQTKVRIYAIGEGVGNSMADYGWIENVKTGEVVWEMTYRTTTHAGGAKKNRLFDRSIVLDKGEYEVHFETDDSHAFNDWNDDPPNDRTHWGITIYKE
jgi:5-hydroxyisourate hydrolase-like protein (transthyretin family)